VTQLVFRREAPQTGCVRVSTLAGKVRALLNSRYNVSFEDVRRSYLPAMRHRVILNFESHSGDAASCFRHVAPSSRN
jgi:MoxR-like ATPase